MSRLTLGDRVLAGAVGAVIGAIIGLVLAWLLGVYSNTLGSSEVHLNFIGWVFWSGAVFAAIGLLFGPAVGTVFGAVITAIFEFENPRNTELPSWLLVPLFLALAFGVWWWLSK